MGWPFQQKPPLGWPIDFDNSLAQGLVGCWVMNEGRGDTVADLSGNGNDGTFVNTPTWTTGTDGPALDFTGGGTDDRVNCGQNCQTAGATAYTMLVFVKWDTLPTDGANQDHLIGRWESIDTRRVLSARMADSTTARLLTSDGASNEFSDITIAALSVDTWYLLAYVYDAGAGAFYLDGRKLGSFAGLNTTLNATPASPGYFSFGCDSGDFGDMDGQMSYAMAYNRALTAGEIAHLYREPFCMFRDPSETIFLGGLAATRNYTRGDYAALPGDDTDLENSFTSGEYTQVETDDADRVAQTATDEYAIFQFKDYAGANTSSSPECNVQSDLAPSSSSVLLQVYNQNSTTWETLDTESAEGANTDFDLTGSVADLTNYKDGSDWVSFRVYQEAK